METHGPILARRSRPNQQVLLTVLFVCLFVVSLCPPARADVGVILNESLKSGLSSKIVAAGHSAVYLSRVCPVSPVRLRLCEPGEQGSVISTYSNFDEDQRFQWNIVPLSVFLYGVEDVRKRPLFASPQVKRLLEEQYRQNFLSAYCSGPPCSTNEKANWRDMVGATFDRSVYVFVMATTVQQDQDFIATFNALPNDGHFNMFFRNCADFTKEAVNIYFPHATHRDYLNDFGMTSPKAVAHSFVRYALHHPDAQLRVLHFAQLPGTIERSNPARDGTEQIFHAKKLLIPGLFLAAHELPVFPISYFLTGRFNPQREWEKHPSTLTAESGRQTDASGSGGDEGRVGQLKAAEEKQRADIVGSSEEWEQYRREFGEIVDEAVRQEGIPERNSLNRFFRQFDQTGRPVLDDDGSLWMQVADSGGTYRVGLNADNIFAPNSDPHLAFELLLARVNEALKSSPHSRETMVEFRENWALLRQAETKVHMVAQYHPPSRN